MQLPYDVGNDLALCVQVAGQGLKMLSGSTGAAVVGVLVGAGATKGCRAPGPSSAPGATWTGTRPGCSLKYSRTVNRATRACSQQARAAGSGIDWATAALPLRLTPPDRCRPSERRPAVLTLATKLRFQFYTRDTVMLPPPRVDGCAMDANLE